MGNLFKVVGCITIQIAISPWTKPPTLHPHPQQQHHCCNSSCTHKHGQWNKLSTHPPYIFSVYTTAFFPFMRQTHIKRQPGKKEEYEDNYTVVKKEEVVVRRTAKHEGQDISREKWDTAGVGVTGAIFNLILYSMCKMSDVLVKMLSILFHRRGKFSQCVWWDTHRENRM